MKKEVIHIAINKQDASIDNAKVLIDEDEHRKERRLNDLKSVKDLLEHLYDYAESKELGELEEFRTQQQKVFDK